MDTGHVRNM